MAMLMGVVVLSGTACFALSIEFEGPEDQIEDVQKTRDLMLKYWPKLAK